MDEKNSSNHGEYAYLHQLPIDKLQELLAVAPTFSTCPEDEAYVDALEEAIIEKENENPTGFFPDVDQQWEQFMTQYLPDVDEAAFDLEHNEHNVLAQSNLRPLEVPPKRGVQFSKVWRTALAAVAAIVCMLAIMVTAQAIGVDVFGAMARWTKDVFSFGQIAPDSQVSDDPAQETTEHNVETPSAEFTSLQKAFDAYGMTEVHEPSWLPEGYALDSVKVLAADDPFLRTFSASYSSGEGFVGIDIMSYEGEPAAQVEKTEVCVELEKKYGHTFYLLQNTDNYTVAWYTDQYEYYLVSKENTNILWKIAASMFS